MIHLKYTLIIISILFMCMLVGVVPIIAYLIYFKEYTDEFIQNSLHFMKQLLFITIFFFSLLIGIVIIISVL